MRLTLFFWLDISNLYQLSWSELIPDPYWTSIHHCFQLSVAKVIMVWRCIKQSLLQEPGNYISWCYMFHYPFLYTKSWFFLENVTKIYFLFELPPPNKKKVIVSVLNKCPCALFAWLDTQGQPSTLLMSIMTQGVSWLKELYLCLQMTLQRS